MGTVRPGVLFVLRVADEVSLRSSLLGMPKTSGRMKGLLFFGSFCVFWVTLGGETAGAFLCAVGSAGVPFISLKTSFETGASVPLS